jgi:ATP-binding cassette subfamily B protein
MTVSVNTAQSAVPPAFSARQLRYIPPLLRLVWSVSPGSTFVLGLLSIGGGVLAAAEVHVLRRLVETAQLVAAGKTALAMGLLWGGALAVAGLLEVVADEARSYLGGAHQERLRRTVEERCFRQAAALPLEALEVPEHYDRLRRARQGTEQRLFSTMDFFWRNVADAATLASLLAYLGQFHWALPILLAAGTTPAVVAHVRQHHRNYVHERRRSPAMRRYFMYLELLTGREAAAELRLFGLGTWFAGRAERLWRQVGGEQLRLAAGQARTNLLAGAGNGLTYLLAIGLSVWLLAGGRAGLGAYAALFFAVERFQERYRILGIGVAAVFRDLWYVGDFFEFLQLPRPVPSRHNLRAQLAAGITFEHVTFTYPGSATPVLVDLCLDIAPGERIALVGENGAGKSTFVRLLLGLYRPTAGRILIDGVDLADVDPGEWYRRCGAVFQSFQRYQTTVRDNVAIGWIEGNTPDTLEEACRRSGADAVAATLPDGLDTALGREFHDGLDLSVGQWQRLAVARAYLRPAEILVLDEPASALDAKAEADVYAHFARMAAGRTVVLVSHRLGSCRIASRVLVLRDGHFVEDGTHAALIERGGEYADLYRRQAAWYR